MTDTPWGPLPVADAHVHFFSHTFFASLAAQKGIPLDEVSSLLGWQIPAADPAGLADQWIKELDRYGVQRAAIIARNAGDDRRAFLATRIR